VLFRSYRAPGPGCLFAVALSLGCGLTEIPVGDQGAPAGDAPAASPSDGGVAAPTAGGVVIAGTPVPRNRALVFLHIGHSNMAGRSETPSSERPFFYDTHPRLWAYARGNAWRPAVEPLSGDSMTRGRAGPGMAILRTALGLAPDAHVISIGHGQSGQTGGYCRSYRRGGLLYRVVMDPALELRGKVTFAAVFVMLGISELDDVANARSFGTCVQGVVRDMREDLGEPGLPFVFGDWEHEVMTEVGPDSDIARIITPQLRALPEQLPRLVLIDTVGLPIEEDDHHYTLIGQKLWAERGFALLVTGGLAPWARAP
jgi:hypothetical protein